MITDELENMARTLGLNKGWKHDTHYDLTENKRKLAVQHGAIETTSRFLVQLRIQKREGIFNGQ